MVVMVVDTFNPILVSLRQDIFVRFWDMEVSDDFGGGGDGGGG